MSKLKNLYTYLMDKRENELKTWHDGYYQFDHKIKEIRERIKAGDGLSPEKDEDFLWRLLGKKSNGIADGGRSASFYFSDDKFHSFIENKEFISSLEQFILDPIEMNFRKFGAVWEKQAGVWAAQAPSNKFSKNPLLVNRVAAACTLAVSTTVDEKRFDKVFSWLIDEKTIPSFRRALLRRGDQDWFSKNIVLMKDIKEEFHDELQNKTIDEIYLSQFIWGLYDEWGPNFPKLSFE